ncbi:MAG: hypothetical protein ACU0DW_11410 [Shimia sp.]
MSLETATTSILRPSAAYTVTLTADGQIESRFIDSRLGRGVPLVDADVPPYDVDRVDDVLATTEREDIADALSDTLCGPEALPQLVATIDAGEGIEAEGTITLIAYFSDRILQVTELTLRSEDAVFFMTETALLTPAE